MMKKTEEKNLKTMEIQEMMKVDGGTYPIVPNLGPYIVAKAVASWIAKHI